jgi:hypothetical protein
MVEHTGKHLMAYDAESKTLTFTVSLDLSEKASEMLSLLESVGLDAYLADELKEVALDCMKHYARHQLKSTLDQYIISTCTDNLQQLKDMEEEDRAHNYMTSTEYGGVGKSC